MMENTDSIKKDLVAARALAIFEGICFFVAGICAIMAGSILGYISGGLLVVLSCLNMGPSFFGSDNYFLNVGDKLLNDKNLSDEDIYEEDEQE